MEQDDRKGLLMTPENWEDEVRQKIEEKEAEARQESNFSGSKRGEGEDFEDYKERRRKENKRVKDYLKGKWGWISCFAKGDGTKVSYQGTKNMKENSK